MIEEHSTAYKPSSFDSHVKLMSKSDGLLVVLVACVGVIDRLVVVETSGHGAGALVVVSGQGSAGQGVGTAVVAEDVGQPVGGMVVREVVDGTKERVVTVGAVAIVVL